MTTAVLLSAGKGTRLWPITEGTQKTMVRVLGKPILGRAVEALEETGVFEKIVIVVSPEDGGIRNHFEGRKEVSFAVQNEPLGTAHAVLSARKEVGTADFAVFNGDTFFASEFYAEFAEGVREGAPFIVGKEVADASAYGVLGVKGGALEGIVEKPRGAGPALVNTGAYYVKNDFFKVLEGLEPSGLGELEATDALVNYAASRRVAVTECRHYWNDVGYFWSYLDTSAYALENAAERRDGTIEDFVKVKGKLIIGKGSVVKSGCYIEGPVFIGDDCVVGPNAYLRPGTVLEGGNHVGNGTEIKNSIFLRGANSAHLSYVGDSIICEDANIGGAAVIANLRFDDADIPAEIKGAKVSSGRRKLGAVIGRGTKVGINASINCGVLIGTDCRIFPHCFVFKNVQSGGEVRNSQKPQGE